MDKELILLQRKVQEMTNHVAVLPKKLIRSVRMPMMVVRLKCHSIVVNITQYMSDRYSFVLNQQHQIKD
jgi:hypothetical protein